MYLPIVALLFKNIASSESQSCGTARRRTGSAVWPSAVVGPVCRVVSGDAANPDAAAACVCMSMLCDKKYPHKNNTSIPDHNIHYKMFKSLDHFHLLS